MINLKKNENLNKIITTVYSPSVKLDSILVFVLDSLVLMHKKVMAHLNSFDSYDDLEAFFYVHPMVEQDGDIMLLTDKLLLIVSDLINELNGSIKKIRNTLISISNINAVILDASSNLNIKSQHVSQGAEQQAKISVELSDSMEKVWYCFQHLK